MAPKRKAQDAFGTTNGQLSAVAAARLAKQQRKAGVVQAEGTEEATQIGAAVYDDYRDDFLEAGIKAEREDVIVAQGEEPSTAVALSYYDVRNVERDDDSGFQVMLQLGQNVTAVGEYDLQVLKGTVNVYGATFQAKTGLHRIYAPTSQAVAQIHARKDNTSIRLRSVRPRLRKLERLSPLYRGLCSKGERSFAVLGSSAEDTSRNVIPLHVDQAMDVIVSKLCGKAHSGDSPRVMAIGSKSCGKSTFNRYLVNSLLTRTQRTRCLYLDLDPGQPEFGPPGTVSLVEVAAPLLGPSYSHIASKHCKVHRLIRSHAVAATSFKDDPDHYLACAEDLIQWTKGSCPIIINSCGWVSGLGATILVELSHMLSISDVVVHHPVEDFVLESLDTSIGVHVLVRRAPRPSSRSPAEARNMLTMSYFHQRIRNYERVWKGSPIDTWTPWLVSFAENETAIHGVLSYGQHPQTEFLSEILDGSIVALVTQDRPSKDVERWRTPEGLPHVAPNGQGYCEPLDPNHSECVGLALVRAIDVVNKELHLVTPLSEEDIASIMQKRVLLVRGGFDPPDWAFLEALYLDPEHGGSQRPWISRREMVGIEGAVWRLRHPPMASAALSR